MTTRRLVAVLCLGCLATAGAVATEPASSDMPWSFRPLAGPPVPNVSDAAWPRDDIDRFVLAKLSAAGLAPNPDADRAVLIRRLAYDLLGLPPTEAEMEQLLSVSPALGPSVSPSGNEGGKEGQSDGGRDWYTAYVDKLLSSPRFGERWGRHWLDVARYADNTGRAWNAPMTYAWRYRDYVIDAFNKDKPFDRFIAEQLAGDLLPAKTVAEARENRIATGFLALGAHDLQNLSHEQFVMDGIDDQIDVTTRAFLGLSVACARCHDHKYDPVTMRDYYALAGVFTSTTMLPGVAHQRESYGGGYVNPTKLQVLPTEGGKAPAVVRGVHSMYDYQDEWRTGARDIFFATDPHYAIGAIEAEPRDCEIRNRGEPWDRGNAPPRGDMQIPGLPRLPQVPGGSSGRLELARWLTSPENPLTARVMVNRVWQHLFGRGLVLTVDDFGASSEPPANPELIDHLAARFRDEGWSIKRLIRAIVLSRTYRQSSATQAAGQEKDPDNALLWRMNLRRLEWEPLRDSLLEVSGRLSDERPAGIQVAGIGGKSPKSQVRSLLPITAPYRTVYLPVLRDKLAEETLLFDFPNPCLLQGQREVTTVAPQALFFMNSDLVARCARDTADLLMDDAGPTDADRAAWAYQRVLRRLPTAEETTDAIALVNSLDRDLTPAYHWAALIQALFASAEFRYVR